MADQEEGIPAPNPPTAPPQAAQAAQAPQAPQTPQAPQGQQLVHINWSYFKPEFSENPDEDAEAHLFHTNDWMNAHHINKGVKVQRFFLTLLGEARLWYQSLEPINADWQGLQNLFSQQYSKICNTREKLFHAWRSFNFDENIETIDAYATHIGQVAALLGYGEPQILEVFKNTLPTKLYRILFPIEDLRQAVEIAKRILTKEKLDRKLTGQSSCTPFMSIRDSHQRRVSFDTTEELGDKIDKLVVMIGKLAKRVSRTNRWFKPQIHQSRGRGQNRNYNYNQRNHQDRYRSNNRLNSRNRGQYRQDRSRPRYEQNFMRGNFRGNIRNYGRHNSRGEYRNSYRNDSYDRSRNRSSVMYGSAGLLALLYLGLSRGIVSHIYLIILECTTIHNAHLQVL